MPHKSLCQQLLAQQRICSIDQADKVLRIAHEQYSLQRLKKAKTHYLNTYDQVFRLVSLWLLHHDYDLTQHQPHQVFKAVLRFHCEHIVIEPIVQHRHELKKGIIHQTNSQLWENLMHCHDEMSEILQAYNLIPTHSTSA